MISQSTINSILETARIEEVVGEFVPLKRRGVSLIGLCPFHHEKTPSFNVSIAKGIYKCFGCGKGGDSVNFLMEHEHYSYPEALRYLAHKYHIEIEEDNRSTAPEESKNEKESLFLVSAFAQGYFSDILYSHNEGKAIGLSYFKERGFTDAMIKKFGLGYSLDSRRSFTEKALQEGYNVEFLVKTGLSIEKEGEPANAPYDRFRGRVLFPIHNQSGRVIAFGGRILTPDAKAAKYVNSPESLIYSKSKMLYGIYFARNKISAENNCYLVEGYTDVISLHQAGIENVVASCGTSLTVDQIRMIGRYTKNITVLYDGDQAGIHASERGLDMILEEGLNVRMVLFPDGDDPDSFPRRSGS